MEESIPSVNNVNDQVVTNPGSKNLSIKISSILVVILIVLGGASYAYYIHQQNNITMGNVIVNTIDAVKNSKIKSVEFSSAGDISIDFKELNTKNKTTQTKNVVAPLIDGANLSISLNGIVDGTVKDNLKIYGKVNFDVKFDAPDGSQIKNMLGVDPLVLELEYYAFPDSIYFKLNKIPAIVDTYVSARGVKVSSYLNRWFVINETEITLFKKGFVKGFVDASKKNNKNFSDNPFVFNGLNDANYEKLKVALIKYYDLSGAVDIISRKRETTLDGQNVTAIYYSFNNEKYISTEKDLIKDIQSILSDSYPNLNLNADMNKMFDGVDNNDIFKNVTMSNMKFLVGSDGYFHGSEGSINIKANDATPSVSENVKLSLKNYNKNFNLEKPKDAQNLVEVFMDIQDSQNRVGN